MRTLLTILACASALAALAAPASGAERLNLDLRDSATETTAVATAGVLAAGQDYVISVQGTGSIWSAGHWSNPGVCGAPEAAPMFASPNVQNGPVGWDAETVFSVPPGVGFLRTCDPSRIPFHVPTQSGGGFKIDLGTRFFHFEPVGGARTTPRADHLYFYDVKGEGNPARFSFFDDTTSGRAGNDNYGMLQIVVRTAAECAAVNCKATAGREFDRAPSTTPGATGTANNSPDLRLPSSRRCASRRRFEIRLRERKGVRFAKATVTLDDRVFRTYRKGKGKRGRLRARIDLSGLPAGQFKVQIIATTTRGQVLRSARTYRTCKRRSESGRPAPRKKPSKKTTSKRTS